MSAEGCAHRRVTDFDAMTVSVLWTQNESMLSNYVPPILENGALSLQNSIYAPICRGSPFMTVFYNSARAALTTPHAITRFCNIPTGASAHATGYRLDLNNGQSWLIFIRSHNPPLPDSVKISESGQSLVFATNLTGCIRIALLTADRHVPEQTLASRETLLSSHCMDIPIGCTIRHRLVASSEPNSIAAARTVEMRYEWSLLSSATSKNQVLMLCLPHHAERLVSRADPSWFSSIKGPMAYVRSSTWVMRVPIHAGCFSPRIEPAGPLTDIERGKLLESLRTDIEKTTSFEQFDTYWFGKHAGRLARLLLIAEEIGEKHSLVHGLFTLKNALNSRLNTHNFIFDQSWGGIISSKALLDRAAEYGAGWYNDHHFHYGYLIYAAYVVAHLDPEWLKSPAAAVVDALVEDVTAMAGAEDFPQARHKDMYEWHSWASGLFEFGDSKNQESSSEAVNCYYAATLWNSLTPSKSAKTIWSALLLEMEILAAQKYFQINASSPVQIYPNPFRQRGIVGVLWSTKADYATWFGANPEYIFGIQMLPFTPISSHLLSSAWLQSVKSTLETITFSYISDEWKGLLLMALAKLRPESALRELERLKSFEAGNSKTNFMHWCYVHKHTTMSA